MRKLMICWMAAVVLTGALSSCQRGTTPDYEKLNARAAREYLEPIRPGVPGQQPFWNVYANKFIFAPAFDFPEAEGAAKYRFDLWLVDTLWKEYDLPVPEERPSPAEQLAKYKTSARFLTSFQARSPKADLSPVWESLPVGHLGLVVMAVNASDEEIGPVGTWEFLRDFPFTGPYPGPSRSYQEAALMALYYNHRQPIVEAISQWKEGKPFNCGNIYASKFVGSVIQSEALMSRYIPSRREECLENARKAADILISLAPPEGAPLAHFPPTYYDSGIIPGQEPQQVAIYGSSDPDAQLMTMTLDPLYALRGYLALYDVSGEKKYFDEAIAMMRTYDRLIDSDGFVPKKLYVRTGEGVNQDGALTGDLLLLIQQLHNQYGVTEFDALARRCERWMWEHAMKEFDMSAQFEDVSVEKRPYQNLTVMTAGHYARYLLQKENVSQEEIVAARDLLHFMEDQFVHWAQLPDADGLHFCLSPGVYEQYACRSAIDASNDCFADAALSYYEKTGDELMLQKALAVINTVVNSQAGNGEIATFMRLLYRYGGLDFWLNCSVHSIVTLLRFAEHVG